jgi:hypothetical protein
VIITGNRQEEIIARATKRLVTAMIYMMGPQQQTNRPQHLGNQGFLIEKGKPALPLTAKEAFLQNVEVWRWNDECVTPLQKKPDVLLNAIEVIGSRTKRINSGDLAYLDLDAQKAVFDSKDIISRATGVPPQIHFDFIDAVKTKDELIEEVPFVKLKKYLKSLESSLETVGGQVTGADISHTDYMSAFDYYEIGFGHHLGHRFYYGDVMLAKGRRTLEQAANNTKLQAKLN